MIVYVVKKIRDYEYGFRDIEAIFSTMELALEYVENSPQNYDYKFWNDTIEPNLIIEEYEVK